MKKISFILAVLFLTSCQSTSTQSKQQNTIVTIVGAMKNVMKKGELYGTINLDTIVDKQHLYGLGPVEYLRGEVLILDGKCYKSSIDKNGELEVEETYSIKSPFFGYSTIEKWTEKKLPNQIRTINQLEEYIQNYSIKSTKPFFFKIKGKINTAKIHVVNLPKGSKVNSPKEAHQGQMNFELENENIEILGFFSTEHQAIFTHHDTFLHMHLITEDKSKMGHLDKVDLKIGTATLYVPKYLE